MGYIVFKCGNNNDKNWKYFYCDRTSDIELLPTYFKEGIKQENDSLSYRQCSPGSRALCLENSNVYILNKDEDKWIKQDECINIELEFYDE